MKTHSDEEPDWETQRKKIIGLGESSIRKSYYPELQKQQEALKESVERFRNIFTHAAEGILIADISTQKFLHANPAICSMLGYSAEELTSMEMRDIHPEKDLAHVQEEFMAQARGEKILAESIPVLRKDGAVRYMDIRTTPVMIDGHHCNLGMFTDITERKRAEENLHVNEERLIMAQEIGHTGSWEYNLQTGKIWGSAEGARIYGFPAFAGDFPIDTIEACIPERERVHQALVDLIQEGKEYNLEFAINPADGSGQKVIISCAELEKDAQGNAIRVVGVIQDITKRKKAEDTLALTARKLTLMNDVTYQYIQNKVTAVRGFAELSKDAKTDAERVSFIETEECILADIHQLIKNTRQYQEIGILEPQWISMEQSIRIAVSLVSPKRDISIETPLHGLELYSDPLIEKIFSNLVDNAVKHGKTTTHIRFSCEERPDGLILVCEDDGVGISPEVKARLFDRSVGEKIHFGLFFIHECLALSGMTIHETGEHGKGAKFEITVPKGMYRFTGTEQK
jgi:PAS domain S-box-containing protein